MTRRGDRGSALLIVLILAVGIAAAIAALMPAVAAADRTARDEAEWMRAGHIADAGMEYVFALMRDGQDTSGNNLLALGDGSAFVRVDKAPAGKDIYIVESTANLNDDPGVLRSVRATVRREGKKVSVLRWERP